MVENKLIQNSKLNNDELFNKYNTTIEGYSSKRAKSLLEKNGKNLIKEEKKDSNLKLFVNSFVNYFNGLLFFIIIVSLFTDIIFASEKDFSAVIILSSIIFISGIIQFVQEKKSITSLNKLKELVINTTAVIRNNKEREIHLENVVVGDIIKLSAGDIIPADIRILEAKDLFVSQSTFTGESEPVEKIVNSKNTKNVFDLDNICLLGTDVISGTAKGIVVATGDNTYLANMTKEMEDITIETSFDKGIKKVSSLLIKFTLILTPVVFMINYFNKGSILTAFLFALTVAVGTTPELLPMIINSNLAKGLITMSKKKVIVKNLNSIQNLGAIDILCTDKTGTITEDKIILEEYLNPLGEEDLSVLNYAYLNSYYQTGLKNLLDIAIINRAEKNNLNNTLTKYNKVDEIPFDFKARRMSVVLKNEFNSKILITKGASEEILAISKYALINNEKILIDEKFKNNIIKVSNDLNKKGLRVITVAIKDKDIRGVDEFSRSDELDMTIVGFVSFLDPPKESAKEAIKLLRDHGVQTKVITGDNEAVAKNVCSAVGIKTKYTLNGDDIKNMSDHDLEKVVEKVTLFSKIAPLEKARIIKALQKNDHVVGYMGDGINDAPALKQADVGISVDGAVEIAKETANIVLLEKSLLVLEEGIVEGRKVFANIMKYLNMSISSNVGNMISFIVASIFIPFLPILPIQILLQNLLYDISQMGISFDKVDDEYLQKPKRWNIDNMLKFTIWFGPTSSIFDFITFAVLWIVIGANSVANQALFQSGWFMMGVVSQTLIIYVIRTKKSPFYKSKTSKILLYLTLFISIIGIAIPYMGIGKMFGLVAMPISYIFIVVLIITLYLILTEIVKIFYVKKYNELY